MYPFRFDRYDDRFAKRGAGSGADICAVSADRHRDSVVALYGKAASSVPSRVPVSLVAASATLVSLSLLLAIVCAETGISNCVF